MIKKIQILFLSIIILLGFDSSSYKSTNQIKSSDQKAETKGPENGTLLIIGGRASDIFYTKFMDFIGGSEAPIVVIPTAVSSDTLEKEFLDEYKKSFIDKGFIDVTVLHTRNTEESNTEDFIAPIKKAAGIWFSGGRQWRHADSYLNTKAHDAFKDVLKRGGVIAGSSAGATIQGSYLARGDTKKNTIMMGDHEEGLSFLSNVAIDQHLFARNRQFDMYEILDNRPELLGIGLDENTGIVVKGDKFRVIGESYVAIYDGTRWSAERDTIYQLPEGSREFYLLKKGNEYDLKKRKVITFDDREFINLSEKQLKKYIGIYQLKDNSLRLKILNENDSLKVFQVWNERKYSILPESDTRFFINNSELSFEFEIDDNGAINRFFVPSRNEIWEKIPDKIIHCR